ncbi:hypothetical protein NVP1026O_062 [Vibrio phage 1.026.O._10N.222.49.C7]|uniref:Uncharacterized protein n=1 Tax=Vibrio phage 1.026.O._10N.222.49.C7 TaxID=1881421 RepID=A0A2I7QMP5_9CAUD|nr:hypothetical protein HYP57_gp062 [Vibrio phage 1.026.O._10N.222.49.C7]AUR82653.1 hypothetical protein NVP1026O_062 [Vibrio phage 1.026.O._10N.222.49.C7]
MAHVKITADGLYPLNNDMNTSESTIYVGEIPAGTTIAIGFNDPDGDWTPFPNATLTSRTPLSISHGHDVMIIAFAIDVSGEINISTKKEGLGGLEGLLKVIAENTTSTEEPEPTSRAVLGAYTLSSLTVSENISSPSYLEGVALTPSTTPEFQLVTDSSGGTWIKNISSRGISMVGDSIWQIAQGAGNRGEFVLWSETSTDDGETYTTNQLSLRKKVILNQTADSVGFPAGVSTWAPGSCIRWAMYNKQSGNVEIAAPSEVINGETVEGVSVYCYLTEI